jgi:hypothetical protein
MFPACRLPALPLVDFLLEGYFCDKARLFSSNG